MTTTNPTPTQQGETLERCPLAHAEEKGLHINSSSGMRKWHITCFDCGLYLEGTLDETIRSLAQRWNRRAAVAGPRGDALDQVRALLNSYTQPCTGSCEHSQCPLLRELHAILIKATLERARQTVKPIVDRERKGEFIGDLMNMRLHGSDVIAIVAATRESSLWNCNGYDQALTDTLEKLRAAAATSSPAPAESDDDPDGEVVYLDPAIKGPQWIACPYCGLGTRAQALRGEGVMTGWGECQHYYSASNDAATKPGLFFVRVPQPLTTAPAERTRVEGEQAWKCACGWRGTPSQMAVSHTLRTCPQCGASGGLILDNDVSDSARRAAGWIDAGGHVWEIRSNVECVECPHCAFTFASMHTVAPEDYDCPNCEGCPDFAAAPADNDAE